MSHDTVTGTDRQLKHVSPEMLSSQQNTCISAAMHVTTSDR